MSKLNARQLSGGAVRTWMFHVKQRDAPEDTALQIRLKIGDSKRPLPSTAVKNRQACRRSGLAKAKNHLPGALEDQQQNCLREMAHGAGACGYRTTVAAVFPSLPEAMT